ncbi:carbohydrate ABC transporter permease [Enemella evansiae]|uniref:Sugar ABC transporter permease n=1 Tax=Enemella evansiae TaxID=2016499 RepID=A0A255GPY5_9ACTN|nr:carbohydrate ABC transporter permease [Enemella evansiae]PFG69189.1 N-acetylglucosamine transport system permease protein [Propionibacteriaceae bacterium ES.041]OYN96781.1 sugar ABC transporter permease [Enemella evansiae]OYO00821.1 sugar ABC transporter permease [Enemella evansiae]OYO02560.1 sugar ABC transporter permease [Enemella evansiae]OYO12088.1 sugar ABC transporter permease [Enemella evansiae]
MTLTDEQVEQAPTQQPLRRERTGRGLSVVTQVVLIIWTLVTVIPVLWVFSSSLKTDNEIFVDSWKLPKTLMFQNYARAWGESGFASYFLNTVIIVGCSVVLVMVLGSMVSYCLARYEFPGRKILLGIFVGANAVPMFVALVPLFGIMRGLELLGTYRGMIAVYTAWALSFTVFFLTSFFRALPKEVYEASFVDGAGHFKTFFLVMLPMARPGLVSIGIFNLVGLWNQYLIPLFLNPDPSRYVITQGLARMAADAGYRSDFSGLFAGLVIGMAPVLILYFIFQKQIQTGMTAGAVK